VFWRGAALRVLGLLALLAAAAPGIAGLAQDEPEDRGATSPASRHAQVIAHGVMTMPSTEVAWQLGQKEALAPDRSAAEAGMAGFLLANDGDVAITNANGEVQARLGPGEAVWTEPGAMRAVVSAERTKVDYLAIALVPAQNKGAGNKDAAVTASFVVPADGACDVDLIRDILNRDEESVIPASTAPMLLVVTGGKVFVDAGGGQIDEISAGEFAQVSGDVVITGASRAASTFVVARIGSSVPPRVALQGAFATPLPLATPVAAATSVSGVEQPAAVRIAAFVCPVAYAKHDFAADCRESAPGVAFSIEADGETVSSRVTDAAGVTRLANVAPGDYTLLAGIPRDLAVSRATCRDGASAQRSEEHAPSQVALALKDGDTVDCDWYVVPIDERFQTSAGLMVNIRACPVGMTPLRLNRDACGAAPPGTTLTLRDGESGVPVEVAPGLPGAWRWEHLAAHAYDLDVDTLPTGFTDSALDGQPCCGEKHDFTVAMPKGFRQVERTLFLFLPDVPRDHSLTVHIHACPAGMTGETLVAELCQPAPPGTTLSLRDNGAIAGVAAAAADAWGWKDLGALTYDLAVNALPPGFTGYQLDDEPCCASKRVFPIALTESQLDAQRTLYLFQPAAAGLDLDSDDDGLLDTQEVKLGTHPFLADTDGDGLADGDEVDFYGTDPLRADTDGDGLDDAEEVQTDNTNPLIADTDGDGVADAKEIAAGSDPLDGQSIPTTPTAIPTITPIPTATPFATATAPPMATPGAVASPSLAASPAARSAATPPGSVATADDLDRDGLATLAKVTVYDTNLTVADSDGDGVNDGDEVAAGTDPREPNG
jgi:hypothetical protein